MTKSPEPPNPFLQLLAYLYGEPNWEHPDPHFMDREPEPRTRPRRRSRPTQRPAYLAVLRSAPDSAEADD